MFGFLFRRCEKPAYILLLDIGTGCLIGAAVDSAIGTAGEIDVVLVLVGLVLVFMSVMEFILPVDDNWEI